MLKPDSPLPRWGPKARTLHNDNVTPSPNRRVEIAAGTRDLTPGKMIDFPEADQPPGGQDHGGGGGGGHPESSGLVSPDDYTGARGDPADAAVPTWMPHLKVREVVVSRASLEEPWGFGFGTTAGRYVMITAVVPGSPADVIGLKVGEPILSVNGRELEWVGEGKDHADLLKMFLAVTRVVMNIRGAGGDPEIRYDEEWRVRNLPKWQRRVPAADRCGKGTAEELVAAPSCAMPGDAAIGSADDQDRHLAGKYDRCAEAHSRGGDGGGIVRRLFGSLRSSSASAAAALSSRSAAWRAKAAWRSDSKQQQPGMLVEKLL